MNKRTAAALIVGGTALILDSRCAAQSARDALDLCTRTLVPSLFPLLVIAAALVPCLGAVRIPILARTLGIPSGAEGIWLLGAFGGFPVGAASIAQSVQCGALTKSDGERMLGLCSLCGPAFLFGVLPQFLPIIEVFAIFLIQMETSLLLGACWSGRSTGKISTISSSVSLTEAVQKGIHAIFNLCAWVTLAGVAAGFLRRWLFPFLPEPVGIVCTGLMELTGGIFALPQHGSFLLATLFVCFGGVSVLLQIGGLASEAGLSMGQCVMQKLLHAALGTATACLWTKFGFYGLLFPLVLAKMGLEIPRRLLYNTGERKGSECCFGKRWSGPASTAASARK